MRIPGGLFLPAVALGGLAWALLALSCWIFPILPVRIVLALFTGVILAAGLAWYGYTSWQWRQGTVEIQQLLRPAVLFLFGWMLCLGSSLAAGFPLKTWLPEPPPPAPTRPERPPSKLFVNGPRRYLADMEEIDVKTAVSDGWPFMKNGKLNEKSAILVEGKLAIKGLSMHPPGNGFSSVRYRLDDEAAVFKGTAAMDDTGAPLFVGGHFEVLGDGNLLWKSKLFTHQIKSPEECSVPVAGVRILELRYHCPGFNRGHHAVWVNPRILQTADTPDRD